MSAPALRTPLPRAEALAPDAPLGAGRAWTAYLVLAALLLPFIQSIGPGQVAMLDVLNFAAILVFTLGVLTRRPRFELPLILPAFVILAASLFATVNANAPGQGLFTLIQDVYLYLWFVVIANVCAAQRDLKPVRVAWMIMSAAISLYGVYTLMHRDHMGFAKLLSPSGDRAQGTFGNANFFADYLVISFFVVASLSREVRWWLRWPAVAALLLGIVASKSLGSMLAMFAGLTVWAAVRATTRSISRLSVIAMVLVLLGVGALGAYLVKEMGVGEQGLRRLATESVAGRFQRTSQGRMRIWTTLLREFERHPMGIGPGNSSTLILTLENRERRGGSVQSKEAHNDYMGYLVERGPFALLAMLASIVLAFRWIVRGFGAIRNRRWRADRAGAWTAALAAGLTATTVHSMTVEKLHFRHFWLFLAMLWALSRWMARAPEDSLTPERESTPAMRRAS